MKRFNRILISTLILTAAFGFFADSFPAQQTGQNNNQAFEDDKALALYKHGNDLMKEEEFAEAVKVFKQVVSLNPQMPGVYVNLTRAYLALGKHDDAERMARREIELNPTSAMAYNNSGYALSMLVGLKEDAITMYKKAIALDPKLRRAYINLADLYHTLGIIGDDDNEKSAYLAKAFAVLENFLEIQPNDEYALAALVDVAITGRRYKEAVAVSLELVKIKPEDFNAQKALGMAYLQAGSPAEAVKAFEKASDLKLNDLESMRYLGIALATSGQRKRALMILKRIVPDQFGLYFGLGMNAVFDKKIDDAVEYFEQAVSIEPDSTDAIYQLALSYSSAGNRQAALEQHAKLKKISPEDAEELFERINR